MVDFVISFLMSKIQGSGYSLMAHQKAWLRSHSFFILCWTILHPGNQSTISCMTSDRPWTIADYADFLFKTQVASSGWSGPAHFTVSSQALAVSKNYMTASNAGLEHACLLHQPSIWPWTYATGKSPIIMRGTTMSTLQSPVPVLWQTRSYSGYSLPLIPTPCHHCLNQIR